MLELECERCDKELDIQKEDTYRYTYTGDLWCKECMDEEVNRPLVYIKEKKERIV